MSNARRFDIAAIAMTIAVLVGLGFGRALTTLLRSPWPHPRRRSTGRSPRRKHGHLALVIGDSYQLGKRSRGDSSYACMAAAKLGWLCDLAGGPGTGYLAGGPATGSPSRTGHNRSRFPNDFRDWRRCTTPTVVILDGGRNDLDAPREKVFNAMSWPRSQACGRTGPRPRIVFIRPRFLSRPDDDLGFDDAFIARLLAQPGCPRRGRRRSPSPVRRHEHVRSCSPTTNSTRIEKVNWPCPRHFVDSLIDIGFAPTT